MAPPPPAKKPRPSLEGSAYDPAILTSTLRNQLKGYAMLATKLDSTLKDVNQVHTELDHDNKPINLVKGRLDRLYDQVGEETNQELKRLDQAIETLDILMNMTREQAPIQAPAVTAIAAASSSSTSAPSSAPSPAGSAAGKKRGPYKKKDKAGDVGSRAGSPTNSVAASPTPFPNSPSATSPALARNPTVAGKGTPALAASTSSASSTGTLSTSAAPTSKKSSSKTKKESSSATSAANLAFHSQLPLGAGRQVAFRQPAKAILPGEEKQDEWILARVITSIGGDKHRYQVEDVDYDINNPTPDGGKYNTTTKSIIPLPDKADPKTYPDRDFTPGQAVMALYPDTTSFYRAFVQSGPVPAPGATGKKKDKDKVYRLKFDDDDDLVREIPLEFVVDAP